MAVARSGGTVPSALVGFDGFIDSILHMVDRRLDMSPSGYVRFNSIAQFAARCAAAAGKSTNIEQVLIEDRFGGNGPLMAGALGRLGMPTTYIGAVSDFSDDSRVHRVFAPFAERCREVITLCPPSTTDCLEFDDGKLMFNNTANVQRVTWDLVRDRVGPERLHSMVDAATLIAVVNWSLLGGVPGIWRGLRDEIFPRVSRRERRVFIDLSDPAKRTDDDIRDALALLRELDEVPGVAVTLGLNLSESERIDAVLRAGAYRQDAIETLAGRVQRAAERLRAALALDCVVVHPREGAAAATAAGASAWFEGPFTATPRLSTGAGDHFNGGFAFGQSLGRPIEECLAIGCAVSGAYVRDASSPDRDRLAQFLGGLPRAGA